MNCLWEVRERIKDFVSKNLEGSTENIEIPFTLIRKIVRESGLDSLRLNFLSFLSRDWLGQDIF